MCFINRICQRTFYLQPFNNTAKSYPLQGLNDLIFKIVFLGVLEDLQYFSTAETYLRTLKTSRFIDV
jgi:hypothetical protein